MLGSFGFQQEILIHECFHIDSPLKV